MADKKISALTGATTPLAGTEVLPIVQGGATVKVAVSDLTAGRAVAASSVNKVVITAPATSSTLTIADGKTLAVNDNATLGTGGLTLGNSGGFTAAASKVLTASNSLTLAGTDATIQTFPTTSATIARTDAAQTITGDQTLGTGNLVIGTSGKGIDFSITAHPAGMTSELLDDYEEGTFTPTYVFSGGGGSIVYSSQSGTYRKIGKIVYCTINLSTTSATLGTGTMRIDGLPYPLHSSAIYRNGCGSIGLAIGWVILAPLQTYMIENFTQLFLSNVTGTTSIDLPAANFNTGAGNLLFMSFSYPTVS